MDVERGLKVCFEGSLHGTHLFWESNACNLIEWSFLRDLLLKMHCMVSEKSQPGEGSKFNQTCMKVIFLQCERWEAKAMFSSKIGDV